MGTENKDSCSQRDSAEREGYVRAHRSFRRIWKERDSAQPELLEEILENGNLNRAFKRVKANKGAPGIDGITVEEIGAYLRENQKELIERIRRGKFGNIFYIEQTGQCHYGITPFAFPCARRRTSLTGESPESARWWEGYSRRQGCSS